MTIIDRLEALFLHRGAEAYLGEPVTISQHMLQCAALAMAENASEALVAAALLHDIGHIAGPGGEYRPEDTEDRHHDEGGAAVLEGHFPPLVVEAVRLHVAAKRYLCATDLSYFARLSPASRHSLELQGGPFDEAGIDDFESIPFHREAVRVRRWDDGGKVESATVPSFADLRPLLERVSSSAS
jgi:phosphonate degradation associated HDIG domain protein